ncbi:MAG: hypothetical protein KA536_19385 [Saprospiraceae bacterium]|nr:hypothetical protein [Saprospiraceae bacterium]
MIRKKILLLFAVFITSLSVLHAQKLFYEVIAHVDTAYRTVDVSTKINIPSELKIPGDTVWFHLWANAFSNTRNEFTEEQLKHGLTSFYFRDQNKLSEINDIKVTVQQNPASYVFKDDSNEILGVIVGSQSIFSGNVTIEYKLKLPALVNGLGYEKGNFYLGNFYPKLAMFDNNMWQTYHYRQYADEWGHDSDVLLKLYGLQGFVPFSNGSTVNTNNPLEISAKNVLDLAVVLVKRESTRLFSYSDENNISYRLVFLNDSSMMLQNVDSVIQKISYGLSKHLGKYPFDTLTILIGKGCYACFKTNGMVLTNEPDKDKSVEEWLVSILSEMWVTAKFRINKEKYPWIGSGLETYFEDIYNEDLLNADEDENSEFNSFYNQYLYQYHQSRISKPLNTNRKMLYVYHEYLNRFIKSAAFFHYLSSLVGKENFSATLDHFIKSKERLTPENFIEKLEQISGKELKVVAESYISKTSETDYKILQMNDKDGKLHLSVENLKSDALPFILTVENKTGMKTDFLVNGFSGEKTIFLEYDHQEEIKIISIDQGGFLPEINRENNHFYPNKTLKHGPIKIVNLFKDGDSRVKELRLTPFPLYNDNDGVMLGLNFSNSNFNDNHPLSFAITPVYSFRNKKFLGQSWINYDRYSLSSIFQKVSYRVGLKSYDMNTNKTFNYSQRYIRIDPSVTFHFKYKSFPEKQSSLSLKAFFIQEEYPLFAGGEFDKLQNQNSAIYRLEYDFTKSSALSSTDINIGVEQQSYDQPVDKANYLKVTGVFNQRFMYSNRKNIYFRVFLSGFVLNTERESGSFQNIFSKGSIALIHQGFNDYTYDEYYFSRQNQTRLYDNQTSFNQGGGFKTPLGSSNSYGMSNHFAAAINISTDTPFRIPRWLPLRWYFDFGTFSTYDRNKDKFKNNLLYNGGISFNVKDFIAVHIPLFYSTDLGNLYKGQHESFFSRISFSLDLHKFDFWKGSSLDD